MWLRRPSLWLVLPAMYSTWFVHVKSGDITIPRYLKCWHYLHCGRRLILLQPFFFPISYYFLQAYIWFSRDSKLACDCLAISLWPTSRDLDYHWAPGRMSCKSKSRCHLHRGMHYNKTYAYSLDNKIWCSTVSKAFVRSKNTAPHSLPCSSLRRSGQSLPKSKLFSWEAFIGNQEVV